MPDSLDLFEPSATTTTASATPPALQSLWTRKRDGRTVRVVAIDGAGRIAYWTLGPIMGGGYEREIKGSGDARDAQCWHELFAPNERAETLEIISMAHAAFSHLSFTAALQDRPRFKQRAERAWHALCQARADLPA